jgi:hypothetical protein
MLSIPHNVYPPTWAYRRPILSVAHPFSPPTPSHLPPLLEIQIPPTEETRFPHQYAKSLGRLPIMGSWGLRIDAVSARFLITAITRTRRIGISRSVDLVDTSIVSSVRWILYMRMTSVLSRRVIRGTMERVEGRVVVREAGWGGCLWLRFGCTHWITYVSKETEKIHRFFRKNIERI